MEQNQTAQVFKPCRPAIVTALLWDCVALMPGIVLLAVCHKTLLQMAVGIAGCLYGLWSFLSSWQVLRTHILITPDGIASANSSHSWGIQWNDISDVMIRSRPKGTQARRADRLVVLKGPNEQVLPLNTSVLSPIDESALLTSIKSQVHCPVEEVIDGPFG